MSAFHAVATGEARVYGMAQKGRTKCHAIVEWPSVPLQCSRYARVSCWKIPLCRHHHRLMRRRGLTRYYDLSGRIAGPLP